MIKHFMLLKSVRFSTIINNVHIVKKSAKKEGLKHFSIILQKHTPKIWISTSSNCWIWINVFLKSQIWICIIFGGSKGLPQSYIPSSKVISYLQYILGDPEVTTNLYCNFVYLYWEGCVICRHFWVTQ